MSTSQNTVIYYNKAGQRVCDTCESLGIPEDIFHSIIDNLHATLEFVAQSAIEQGASQEDIVAMCNKSIAPYSSAVSKYGYEFFISEAVCKHEIFNISCMLREI